MLGRRTALATATALILGLIAVAAPAQAGISHWWSFDARPAGLPTSADPALSLHAADAFLDHDETGDFLARVELGAEPDPSAGTSVRISLGHVEGDSCAIDWEQAVPAYDPGGPVTRDGAVITVRQTIGLAGYDSGCGSVALLARDGAVLDRLDAALSVVVVSDPAGEATVAGVRNRVVEPGRWSTVWLRVHYRGGDAEGVHVSGSGFQVAVRQRAHRGKLTFDDHVWVPVQVMLIGRRARKVTFTATPYGDLFRADAVPKTVRIRPAH